MKKLEILTEKEENEILGLLKYSFKDIDFTYGDLTDEEQSIISKKKFKKMDKKIKLLKK